MIATFLRQKKIIPLSFFALSGSFVVLGIYFYFKHKFFNGSELFLGALFLISLYYLFIKKQYQDAISKCLLAFSSILLIIALFNTIQNYSNNEQIYNVSPANIVQEYHIFAHWSFLDIKTNKLDAGFSATDLVKNFKNSLATDGAHRPRWIAWLTTSITPKINTWIAYKFGLYNINAVGFLCGLLVAMAIFWFVWKATGSLFLSAAAFIFYITSLDLMTQSLFLFRVGKQLVIIPFLLLILILHILNAPSDQHKISIVRFILIFVLTGILVGLDEYGWVMALSLLIVCFYQFTRSDAQHRVLMKTNMIKISACVLINFAIIAGIHIAFKPPTATRAIIQYIRPFVFGWVNLIYKIPDQGISHISEIIFATLGFYRWQFESTKMVLVVIYAVIIYLIVLSCRAKEDRQKLHQFLLIHGTSVLIIVFFLLISGRHGADLGRNTFYYYYCSYLVIGLPIYLTLIAYTLRSHKTYYNLSLFVIGVLAFINSVGFTKMNDISETLGFGSPLTVVADLNAINQTIASGGTPVLDRQFPNLRQVTDWKAFPKWSDEVNGTPLADAIHTFPVLYYYLIPYIQEEKVSLREEYKPLFEFHEEIN